jgi:hypothetical protein
LVFASLGFVTMALVACSSDDDDNGTATPDAGVYIDGGIMTGAPPGPTGYGEPDTGTFSGPPVDSGESTFDAGTTDATSPIMLGDGGDDDDDASDAAGGDASDAADAGDAAADASDAGDASDASDAGDAGDADAAK